MIIWKAINKARRLTKIYKLIRKDKENKSEILPNYLILNSMTIWKEEQSL